MRGDAIFSRYYQYALGPEYRRVEYLESSGKQYIDTNAVPDYYTRIDTRVSCIFNNNGICGCRPRNSLGDANYDVVAYNTTSYGVIFRFGNTNNKVITPVFVQDDVAYDIRMDNTGGYIDDKSVAFPQQQYFTAERTLPVFARNLLGNVMNFLTGKCWWFKYTQQGTLIRDLVPAVRVSDSKPGMYDLCGSICPLTSTPFYINAGSGADFAWGELQS